MAGAGGGPGRRQGPLSKLSAGPLAACALLRFIMGLLCLRLRRQQAGGGRGEEGSVCSNWIPQDVAKEPSEQLPGSG